jgi:hypothetical protein
MLRQCHSLLQFLRILIEHHIKQKKGENQYVDVLASTGQVAISECTGNNYVPIWAVLGSTVSWRKSVKVLGYKYLSVNVLAYILIFISYLYSHIHIHNSYMYTEIVCTYIPAFTNTNKVIQSCCL